MNDRSRLAREPWHRLDSRLIHQTPWLKLRQDRVRLPDGGATDYGVVECGHCVGVLPFLDADHVVLVGQYRYVAGCFRWEMPTGGVHDDEPIEAAAQRELVEESGYRADTLEPLSVYHTSKSSMDETAHLFAGRGLTPAVATPDDTELIEVRVFPFQEVLERVLSGEITDSMTLIAVLLAARGR